MPKSYTVEHDEEQCPEPCRRGSNRVIWTIDHPAHIYKDRTFYNTNYAMTATEIPIKDALNEQGKTKWFDALCL